MSRYPTLPELFKGWRVWGVPALVEMLTPWFVDIMKLPLVGEYWQPDLNIATCVLGAVGALIAYGVLLRQPLKYIRTVTVRAAIIVAVGLSICLLINMIGIPEAIRTPTLVELIVYVNVLVYMMSFVTLAVAVMGTFLLFPAQTKIDSGLG